MYPRTQGHHHLPHHHTEWEMEIELVSRQQAVQPRHSQAGSCAHPGLTSLCMMLCGMQVVMLVFVHVLALCFYLWLLVRDKDRQRRGRAGGKSHMKPLAQGGYMSEISGGQAAQPSSPSKARQDRKGFVAAAGGGASSSAASSWRTPKEILAAWGKQRERERLGKV